ncbi:Regulation of nuclear pre-mRNA domain-containing protein 1B [Rhynchospora pubera]|uniref:Regulation of nuclear pre-mRNA domain-containing protein 1B n=1 Tax=Rhynchospora pubera TaxID=906938 RepID=A0AAV8BUB1_9POAL|nr:Regulation of nuclear pre-mRNA domain-containing protein 1B [Rhynchospora pubera]
MSGVFSEDILAEKLSQLNNTQQCIQTLSHWCIFHRKNAEKIVQTWDKQFHSSDKEKKIPLLYVANDILQNSRKNGKEFVEEFWKLLPAALKDVAEHGDDSGKGVVSRLVQIWEERRVFGSQTKTLKEAMLGDESLPELELNKKRARSSIKIVKRDSRSVRIKLNVGGAAEKIVSAFNAVSSSDLDEKADFAKCTSSAKGIGKMEKDVEDACSQVGESRREMLEKELKEEETILNQCIERLKAVKQNRSALVSQLKEALKEQESELEEVRKQIQLAQATVDQAANLRRRLNNEPVIDSKQKLHTNGHSESDPAKKTAAAIAAEVADRLAASSHSQQIMSSVLSSLAQEAKSSTNGGTTMEKPASLPVTPQAVFPGPPGGVIMGLNYGYGAGIPTPPLQPPQAGMMGPTRPMMPLGQMMPMSQQSQPMQFTLQQVGPPGFRSLQPTLPGMPFYHPPS